MIITCASCLTKFNLDNSRVPAKGAKVRCSRCKHLFYIVPPTESKEEIVENFESFGKTHEEWMGPSLKETEISPPQKVEKKGMALEEKEEETFPFYEKPPVGRAAQAVPVESLEEKRAKVKTPKPKGIARRERRGPSRIFALFVVLILLVFGLFYFWTEMGSGSILSPYLEYLEYLIKKIIDLWNQIF